jgi:hypothetical protein
MTFSHPDCDAGRQSCLPAPTEIRYGYWPFSVTPEYAA